MPLFHFRAKSYTFKSMVSSNKRNVLPHPCIKPCIPHVSDCTMLSAVSRKKPPKETVIIKGGNKNSTHSTCRRLRGKLQCYSEKFCSFIYRAASIEQIAIRPQELSFCCRRKQNNDGWGSFGLQTMIFN